MRDIKSLNFDSIVLGDNVRSKYDDLDELKGLIKARGLINALGVVPEGKHYRLVHGFRRYHAIRDLRKDPSQRRRFQKVECVLLQGTEMELTLIQLAENGGRQDLHPWEMAPQFLRLCEGHGLTQTILAKESGYHRSYISKCIGAYKKAIGPIRSYLDAGHYRTDSRVGAKWVLRVCNLPPEHQELEWKEITGWQAKKKKKERGNQSPKEIPQTPTQLLEMAEMIDTMAESASPVAMRELIITADWLKSLAANSTEKTPTGEMIRFLLGWTKHPKFLEE